MKENLLRLAIAVAAILIIAASAAAQGWLDTQGSGSVRANIGTLSRPYDRPGLFFLGRPARVLPPRFAYIYPYGTVAVQGTDDFMVREFRPLDRNGAQIYASDSHVISMIHKRRSR